MNKNPRERSSMGIFHFFILFYPKSEVLPLFATQQNCRSRTMDRRNDGPESMVPQSRTSRGSGLRCGAADFVTRHSMPLLLCSADFVAARRHRMPLQRTSYDGIECRRSRLRTTASYAVGLRNMPKSRSSPMTENWGIDFLQQLWNSVPCCQGS